MEEKNRIWSNNVSLKWAKLLITLWEFCAGSLGLTALLDSSNELCQSKGCDIHLLCPHRQPECKLDICFSCGLHRQIPGYISLYVEGSWFHILVGSSAGMDISQCEVGVPASWQPKVKRRSEIPPSASNFALEFSTNLVDCIIFKMRNISMNTSTSVQKTSLVLRKIPPLQGL